MTAREMVWDALSEVNEAGGMCHKVLAEALSKSTLTIKQPNPERTVLQAFHKTFTPIWETPAIDVTTTPRTGTLNQFALRQHGGNTYFLHSGTKISLRIVVASCF